MEDSAFANRLRKNHRHLKKWAKREGLTAFRLYDRDIPEYPFVVDWYDGRVHLVEYPRKRAVREGLADEQRQEALRTVAEVLEVPPERIFTKTHLPKAWGREQYSRVGEHSERFVVEEQGLKFWVNLGEYLDTGLFLDHRVTRARVREEAKGKRFLNLFAYTGSFTVYAAAGGAKASTTVDMSNTYLDWAAENLKLNGFAAPRHELLRADVTRWLEDAGREGRTYELIVLDPPSFSASKKMSGTFNVQRDQVKLLRSTLALLDPSGVLYFSTNYTGFQLEADEKLDADFEETTPRSIPEDFHRKDVHRCWRVTRR
jgi:23S rRNA (cytosine1962-C5)-methyltransferase